MFDINKFFSPLFIADLVRIFFKEMWNIKERIYYYGQVIVAYFTGVSVTFFFSLGSKLQEQ